MGCLAFPFLVMWWIVKFLIGFALLIIMLPILIFLFILGMIFALSFPFTTVLLAIVGFMLSQD